jgi:hypothetical protein
MVIRIIIPNIALCIKHNDYRLHSGGHSFVNYSVYNHVVTAREHGRKRGDRRIL